jgi:transmembrane protein EpsG
MRQSLAIALFVHAFRYIERRSAVRYALSVLLASTFHASALILLPVYALAWTSGRIRPGAAIGIFTAYVAAVIFARDLKPYIDQVVTGYFTRYEIYQDSSGAELGTGLGLAFGAAVLAVILFFARHQERTRALLFLIAIISYFVAVPLGLVNTVAGRFGMYFAPALIAVIPIVAASMKDRMMARVFVALYVCATLYFFYGFFHTDVWQDAFESYRTIFSSPEIY